MALGRQGERQTDLMIGWAELPRSPGHAFYDRLQAVLIEAGFDGFAEQQCADYYAGKLGRPSLPPGRYFRMHLVGYFEGIDSERGLEWRCADSLSLRAFLRLGLSEPVPDHSWLSRTRSRLPRWPHDRLAMGAQGHERRRAERPASVAPRSATWFRSAGCHRRHTVTNDPDMDGHKELESTAVYADVVRDRTE